jgi:hypothetical protein
VSEDDFGILHDLFTDGTADQTDEQAMENTYSKNSSVIPRNSLFIGHASNPPYPY